MDIPPAAHATLPHGSDRSRVAADVSKYTIGELYNGISGIEVMMDMGDICSGSTEKT